MKEIFYSPTKGKLDLDEMAKDIIAYLKSEPESTYQLIVGTDSEGNGKVEFVTAIVIYRKGKGGRYFWQKFYKDHLFSLSKKIYEEVTFSIQATQKLLSKLKEYWPKENFEGALEIHIDIGENGPTRALIQEVVGMVKGMGFNPKIKPEAYGASVVADKNL